MCNRLCVRPESLGQNKWGLQNEERQVPEEIFFPRYYREEKVALV